METTNRETEQPNPLKLLARFLFNVLAFGLSVSMIVVVAVTQTNGAGERFWPNPPEKSADWITGASNTYCALNHDAIGICAYTYILGGFGIVGSLIGIVLAFITSVTGMDTPNLVVAGLNMLGMIWWLIGSVIIGIFVSRVNIIASRPPTGKPSWAPRLFQNDNIARTWILLIAIFSAIMYAIYVIANIRIQISEPQIRNNTEVESSATVNSNIHSSSRVYRNREKSPRSKKRKANSPCPNSFLTDEPETFIP